jgi:hypothetical protein
MVEVRGPSDATIGPMQVDLANAKEGPNSHLLTRQQGQAPEGVEIVGITPAMLIVQTTNPTTAQRWTLREVQGQKRVYGTYISASDCMQAQHREYAAARAPRQPTPPSCAVSGRRPMKATLLALLLSLSQAPKLHDDLQEVCPVDSRAALIGAPRCCVLQAQRRSLAQTTEVLCELSHALRQLDMAIWEKLHRPVP